MIDWEGHAARLGYPNESEMWKDMYEAKHISIAQLARQLGVSRNVVRSALTIAGIVRRSRGGPNNQRLVVTDELVDEVRRDGVTAVAKRMGLDYSTLYKRLYRVRGLKAADLRLPTSPPPSDETP